MQYIMWFEVRSLDNHYDFYHKSLKHTMAACGHVSNNGQEHLFMWHQFLWFDVDELLGQSAGDRLWRSNLI